MSDASIPRSAALAVEHPTRLPALALPWYRLDVVVLAAVAAALVLRLVRLGVAPLWLDEVLTATWVDLPWGATVRAAMTDNHPPLYFLLLKGWAAIAGHSEWALRLPSAAASCAAVALTAALAMQLAGPAAGRWAAWFAALSPYLVHHGQEARMYAVVAALAAAQLVVLVRFLDGTTDRLGWGFVAAGTALAATHYYAVFLIAGELLALALLSVRTGRVRAAAPAALLTAAMAVGAVMAAWLAARHEAGSAYGLGLAALPGSIWAMLAGYALLPSSEALHAEGLRAAVPYVPVAVAGVGALAVVAFCGWRALSTTGRIVVVATLGAALGAPFAAQLVAPVGMNPRYLAAGMPLFLVLLAAGAPAQLGWNLRSASATALVAIMALGTALHLADPGHGREDVRSAGRWLDANVPADEPVLVTSDEMELLARYHWPARALRLYPDRHTVANEANAAQLAAEIGFSPAGRAVYVVGRAWLSDPSGALQRALRERYAPCPGAAVRGIEILCLRAAPVQATAE